MSKKVYDIELIDFNIGEKFNEQEVERIVKENVEYIVNNDKKCPHFYIAELNDEIIDDESAEEYLRKIRKLFLMNGVENIIFMTKGLITLQKVEIVRKKK